MPLTVHAAWLRDDYPASESQLFLWAEDLDYSLRSNPYPSSSTPPWSSSVNGRQRKPKVPSHPGQVSIGQLRSLLTEEWLSLAADEMHLANVTVWLPSQAGIPLARHGPLYSINGEGRQEHAGPTVLMPWQVTGLSLSPLTSLIFLSHLGNYASRNRGDSSLIGRRLRFGNDLLFWSNAAKFALEILVGQHYLPGLRASHTGRMDARWQPLMLDPRIEQRRDQLVQSMPPICRAYNLDRPADAAAPAELTEHFVAALVDAAVRGWGQDLAPPATDIAAIHWLNRLLSLQPQMHLPPQPAHLIYQEWHHWTEQLYVVRDATFRICFLLEEPGIGEKATGSSGTESDPVTWHLRFFLQARDNPNLMIPAREVWQAHNNSVRVGSRHVDQPQERLLAGLGVASRLFSPVERSLRSPRPELCLLSTDEAYQFLRDVGPVLESSGFGVILPEWWHANLRMRLGMRLRLSASDEGEPKEGGDELLGDARSAGSLRLGFNSLIAYDWELTLGHEQLTDADFEQLAAMHTPLLRVGDRWVELDPNQVQAAKRFLSNRKSMGFTTLLQSIRVAQEHLGGLAGNGTLAQPSDLRELPQGIEPPTEAAEILALESVTVTGWLRSALDRLRSQQPLQPVGEPPGFVGDLRPYQKLGVGWLVHLRQLGLGACLADDMGLGKTVQTIALLLQVRKQEERESDTGAMIGPTLLICPTSIVANWRREVERFAPTVRSLVHHGNNRLSGAEFEAALGEYDLIITSYGTARRDVELLQQHEWGDLILDEAQNIKTPSAKQTQAVRRLRGRNRVALTGTPVENRLSELWSIMEFLNPGYLGSHEQFRQRYTIPIERYNNNERTDDLRKLVQPFLLRRLKSDPTIISDLPEKNEMVIYCTVTREQAELYDKTVRDALAELQRTGGIQRRGLVLALLTRLKQITNHPAHFLKQDGPLIGRSGKLNRLTEMLEEALTVGDRALIFTQFVEMGHLLQRHLGETMGIETLFLHGATSANRRDGMVQSFQSQDGPPVFVLSLRAGGSGLNLTHANHVFHYDRWWNPAVENQATDRAFRIGQLRNVQVHKFVVAGTLEESIHDLIESKQALAHSVVGSGEEWLTEMDTDELHDLLRLRYDAIEGE